MKKITKKVGSNPFEVLFCFDRKRKGDELDGVSKKQKKEEEEEKKKLEEQLKVLSILNSHFYL